jgi:hypothetical protein
MTGNPYAPPTAPVTDVEPGRPLPRPREVKLAILLFWFSLAVSLVMWIGDDELQAGDPDDVVPMVLGIVLGTILMVALIVLIGRARNWARMTYVALVILGWISVLVDLPGMAGLSWFHWLGYVSNLALDAAVVTLLFRPASNRWFRVRGLAAPAT